MSWPEFLDLFGKFLRGVGWIAIPLLTLPVLRLCLSGNKALNTLSRHLIKMIDSLIYLLGEIIKWAIPLMVLIVALTVFAEAIFGLATTKMYEAPIYLHAASIFLGSAAALLANEHVRVDLLHVKYSLKRKARLELCAYYLFLMPVCLVILWAYQSGIKTSWRIFEGFPEANSFRALFLLKTCLAVFCVTMITQGLALSLRAAHILLDELQPDYPGKITDFYAGPERS